MCVCVCVCVCVTEREKTFILHPQLQQSLLSSFVDIRTEDEDRVNSFAVSQHTHSLFLSLFGIPQGAGEGALCMLWRVSENVQGLERERGRKRGRERERT